jgi:hypothetical protein
MKSSGVPRGVFYFYRKKHAATLRVAWALMMRMIVSPVPVFGKNFL